MNRDKLEAALDDIKHQYLVLDPKIAACERSCMRPELAVWAGYEETRDGQVVAMKVGPSFGEGARYIELRPSEARAFAKLLADMADNVDAVAHQQSLSVEVVR